MADLALGAGDLLAVVVNVEVVPGEDTQAERSGGRHVCVMYFFSKLLLGGPLGVRMSGRRRASGDLTLDLSHLDEATAAHEATVGALIAHLSRQGIEACTDLVRVRRVPRFPRVALDMDRWRARPWDFGRPADCLGPYGVTCSR